MATPGQLQSHGASTPFPAQQHRHQMQLSRSVDATAQRGASDVATGSRFDWADLGCGQGFQQVFHPFQATNIPNDSEQLVAAVKAAH